MNKYYVYAHSRPDNGEIFYIGKGISKRKDEKIKRNDYWKRIVKKYGIDIKILIDNLEESKAYEKENELIVHFKKQNWCKANMTLGGDGVKVEKRWWGKKISKAMKGKNRESGIESHSYKNNITKNELIKEYITLGKNSIEIGKKYNLSCTTITSRLLMYDIKKRLAGRKKIKIKCVNDNKVFNSITEAAKYYGVYRENINKVLCGKYKHTGNLIFKKLN